MAEQEQQQADPTVARAFLSDLGLPADKFQDTEVLPLYETVKTKHDGIVQSRIDSVIKERGEFGPKWRETLAGDNPKHMETLQRFESPKALHDSYTALRQKLSSGELRSTAPFPEKGTDEQKAQWRSEQGIPALPENYEIKAPEGVVFGEEDKPFLDGFKKHAHATNMTPQAVNAAVGWWAEERTRRQEAAAEATNVAKQATEDKLRSEWGEEFRPNMNRITSLLESNIGAGSELKDQLLATVGTSAEFATLMAKLAFQINPSSTNVGGQGGTSGVESMTQWLTKADDMMKTNRTAYNKSEYSRDYTKYAAAYQKQTGKAWGTK